MTVLKTEKKESAPIIRRVERKPNPNYKGNNNTAYKGKTPTNKPSANTPEDRSKNY